MINLFLKNLRRLTVEVMLKLDRLNVKIEVEQQDGTSVERVEEIPESLLQRIDEQAAQSGITEQQLKNELMAVFNRHFGSVPGVENQDTPVKTLE